MNVRDSKITIQYWNIILLSALIVVLYSVINWLTPVWCDDLDYGAEGRIFSDIFHREFHDYLYANGRIFSHTLVQLFVGMLGKSVFNLLNPVMTMLMVLLIPVASGYGLSNTESKWKTFLFISFAFVFVWFVLPDQYITMFMVAGSSNYIWAAVLNLLFVALFVRLFNGKEIATPKWIGLCILSFLAGTWMELYSVALVPALFCYILLNWKNCNKKVLLTFCLYAIGAMIVIFAPGNFVRQGETVGVRASFSTWMVNQLELAIKYKLIWIWICSLVLLIVEKIFKLVKVKEFLADNLIWIVSIIVSYAFLYVSGVVSWRSQWGIFIFSFVPLFWILDKVRINKYICILFSILALVIVFLDFSMEYCITKTKNAAVLNLLEQSQSKTLTDGKYYLWPETEASRKSFPAPTELNGNWPGSYFRTYYNIDDFIIMPELAFNYCKGIDNDYPLYYDVLPILNNNVIIKCDSVAQNAILEYESDKSHGFVLSGKIGRIVKAFGFSSITNKVYDSKNDIIGGKVLLKELDTSSLKIGIGAETENVFLFDYEGKRYMVAPIEMIKPRYDINLTSCKVL